MSSPVGTSTTSTSWAATTGKELPEGWTFGTKVLAEDLLLDTTKADGWASIIRGEFHCTYQACGYVSNTTANYVP